MSSDKNYGIAHIKKFKVPAIRGVEFEKNRLSDKAEDYTNEIDLNKTKDNVYFNRCDNWEAKFQEVVNKYGLKVRADSVGLLNCVSRVSPEWYATHSVEEAMEFFKKAREFWYKKLGIELNCVAHFDEHSLHLEQSFIPVVRVPQYEQKRIQKKDKDGNLLFEINKKGKKVPVWERYDKKLKDGTRLKEQGSYKTKKQVKLDENGQPIMRYALSAKDIFNGGSSSAMHKLQNEYFEVVCKPFGLDRGEVKCLDKEGKKEKKKELNDLQRREYALKKGIDNNKEIIKDQAATSRQFDREIAGKKQDLTDTQNEMKNVINNAQKEYEQIIENEFEASKNLEAINNDIDKKTEVLDAKKVRNSHLTASLNNAKQNLKTSTETLMSDKERLEQANKRLTELKQIYNELKIKSPTSSLQNSVSRNNFLPQQELRALEEKLEEKKKSNEKLRLEQAKLQRQLNDSLTSALKRTGLRQNSISLKTILDQV